MIEGPKYHDILGVRVASSNREEVLKIIDQVLSKKAVDRPFFVVTAYSEFFLKAESHREFRQALETADLVVGDGVSVWAAQDYLRRSRGNYLTKMAIGTAIGLNVLSGKYKNRVVGVELFKTLLKSGHKIFLLGGWDGVGQKLASRYEVEAYEGPRDVSSITQEENEALVDRVNSYKADIVFVSFGQYKQEKWIAKNLSLLKTKIIIGVGSAFDEVLGEGKWSQKAPEWVEKMGLKWLWRAVRDPRHIKRAWNAFPVFAWRVFKSSL